jgi:two-component system, chemotaxis family, chemotaxis protein CheY
LAWKGLHDQIGIETSRFLECFIAVNGFANFELRTILDKRSDRLPCRTGRTTRLEFYEGDGLAMHPVNLGFLRGVLTWAGHNANVSANCNEVPDDLDCYGMWPVLWLREEMLSALRILIVDDSDVTRRILGVIVRSRQWTVCGEADNGWSGVKKFNEVKPDLVLLDLAMPDMDGIEAARLMSGSDPTVPIILFTVLDLEGLETRAHQAGICAVVSKAQGWNLLKTIETAATQSPRSTQ